MRRSIDQRHRDGSGRRCDYVLRFFAPANGVPEDPVSGVAQCLLAPYWAKRLGKTRFIADQLSPRGGQLECTLLGDRVILAGKCAVVMQGTLNCPLGEDASVLSRKQTWYGILNMFVTGRRRA